MKIINKCKNCAFYFKGYCYLDDIQVKTNWCCKQWELADEYKVENFEPSINDIFIREESEKCPF